jgi:hypothetical protein
MSRLHMPAALAATAAILATVFALARVAPASAQDWKGRGKLQGIVRTEEGKPVAGAKVTLRPGTGNVDPKAPGPAPMTTDKNGRWSLQGLAAGAWGLLVEAPGFIVAQGQVDIADGLPPGPPVVVTLKVLPK